MRLKGAFDLISLTFWLTDGILCSLKIFIMGVDSSRNIGKVVVVGAVLALFEGCDPNFVLPGSGQPEVDIDDFSEDVAHIVQEIADGCDAVLENPSNFWVIEDVDIDTGEVWRESTHVLGMKGDDQVDCECWKSLDDEVRFPVISVNGDEVEFDENDPVSPTSGCAFWLDPNIDSDSTHKTALMEMDELGGKAWIEEEVADDEFDRVEAVLDQDDLGLGNDFVSYYMDRLEDISYGSPYTYEEEHLWGSL